MFELPRYVRKAVEVVADIKKWFEAYYTIQFANYPVDERYLAHGATAVRGEGDDRRYAG
jgi:formylmethanofuran dehydrogenase subunit A